jgi:hypothetical protein
MSAGGCAPGASRSTAISSQSVACATWLRFSIALMAGRSGVLAISPPSQYSPPPTQASGNTGGRLALATTCPAVSPSRFENSSSLPLLTSTAVTITSVEAAFSLSKSTHSSSAASSGSAWYMCVASVGTAKYSGFGR